MVESITSQYKYNTGQWIAFVSGLDQAWIQYCAMHTSIATVPNFYYLSVYMCPYHMGTQSTLNNITMYYLYWLSRCQVCVVKCFYRWLIFRKGISQQTCQTKDTLSTYVHQMFIHDTIKKTNTNAINKGFWQTHTFKHHTYKIYIPT